MENSSGVNQNVNVNEAISSNENQNVNLSLNINEISIDTTITPNINLPSTEDANKQTETDESKLSKISHPKRKFAIIHGYNGHKFHGNQK